MPNIFPAHNDPTEKPVPHAEIRELRCINCKRECKIDDLITYTRLHNGSIIWWHRRKNQDDCDPCKITSYIAPQVCELEKKGLEKKEYRIKKPPKVKQIPLRDRIRAEVLKVKKQILEENKEFFEKVKKERKREYVLQNYEKIKRKRKESYERKKIALRQSRSQSTTPLADPIVELDT